MKIRDQIYARVVACLLIVLAALTSAPAAYAQTADTEATAVALRPLSLVKVDDLEFGNLIAGTAGGTAVVSTAGVRNTTGTVVAAGGTVSNAEFQGYGTRNRFVFVSTASNSYTLNRVGGGANMVMNQLTLQADNLTPFFFPGLFRINSTDVIVLRIGATLNVGANQQEGRYEGTFPITMNYF